jgi:hypothetical protein
MKAKLSLILGIVFLSTALVPPVAADNEPPDVTLLGLELVEKDRRGEIYADPDVDWSQYTEIKLDTATVSFRRNWQRDQNRYNAFKVKTKDMEKIKNHVLHIKPAIVDLDVAAPDTMTAGRTTQFTESAGKMTLKLQMFDSVTGDLIATASDRREAPRRGYMQWTTSVSNSAEAQRMLRRWATGLRERLDKARGVAPEA